MPIGTTELLIISALILVLFAGAWLPRLARRAGRTVKATEPARAQLAQAQAQYNKVDRSVRKVSRLASKASRIF